MAVSLAATPLLLRADSGFCSLKLMQQITTQASTMQREIAFIIESNPRKCPVKTIAAVRLADVSTPRVSARAGKRKCLRQEGLELGGWAARATRLARSIALVCMNFRLQTGYSPLARIKFVPDTALWSRLAFAVLSTACGYHRPGRLRQKRHSIE